MRWRSAPGIFRPIGAESDRCVPPIRVHIAPKRRHLEGYAARDQRHGAMRDAGGDGLGLPFRQQIDLLRFGGRGEIHFRYR